MEATVESFGARLKREREKKGVSLDDISLSTKIGTRLLRALEDEHFDQLPGGIFNRGFVRAYARHLGLDEDQAVADYLAASGDPTPGKPPEPPPVAITQEERREESASGVEQIPWGVLAGALLVIAFGFAIWGFNSREKQHDAREVPGSHSPAAAPGLTASPAPNQGPSNEGHATTGQESASSSVPPSVVAPPPAPGEFVVLVKARDDSWLSITADGQSIMEGLLATGSEKSIPAKQSVALRAGNVGGLDFYFNGKKLPSQGEEGQVKPLSFNQNGLEPPKPITPGAEPAPQPQ
jgi:cytoskeleton protein RodZ